MLPPHKPDHNMMILINLFSFDRLLVVSPSDRAVPAHRSRKVIKQYLDTLACRAKMAPDITPSYPNAATRRTQSC